MGMGEPLLNYKSVISSIDKITSKQGLGMSPKRITVSTAGIAKMIHKLADDEVRFNLPYRYMPPMMKNVTRLCPLMRPIILTY